MTENQTPNNPEAENASSKDTFAQFVEHQSKAVEAGLKAVETLLPPGFKDHAKVAGKEFAAGFKVLVDAAIEGIDKASKDIDEKMKASKRGTTEYSGEDAGSDRPSTTGPSKVKVQVE